MQNDQPRRRAYNEKNSFISGSRSTSHRGRINVSRGNYFRGRSQNRSRTHSNDKSCNPKHEALKSALVPKIFEDEELDAENNITDITGSRSKEQNSDDFSGNDVRSSTTVPSYSTLMQNFALEAPSVKRRKFSHNPFPEQKESSDLTLNNELDIDDSQSHEEDESIEDDEISEDDEETASLGVLDPFLHHFADSTAGDEKQEPKSILISQCYTQKLDISGLGKIYITIPKNSGVFQFHPISHVKEMNLKKKLCLMYSEKKLKFENLEKNLAPFIFDYKDVLFCARNVRNSEILRRLVCLHCLNHILKTRDRVIKNNAKITREVVNDDLEFRDQGFTRPKILFLLPTRQSCVRFAKMIISLYGPEQQENHKRFDDMYMRKFEDQFENKADDFRELFEGNSDDMFRLGLKFTRKSVKYFSQFYNSDVILASPLGLFIALKGNDGKKGDYDFLSSIEIVVVDQADALLMQNWEHMEYIFDHLNLQPKETHGCDFSRVRNWYLDNNANYYRQTITLTAFNTPEINTLLFNRSKNWAGKVKVNASYAGLIQELSVKIKQTFSRLEATSFNTDPEVRFTYFTTVIVPTLTRHNTQSRGTLIFIPSYLDFVRVRNYFSMSQATTHSSFGSISEYSSVPDVARSRSFFFSGQQSFLLYTERAHHFRRYRIRGVKKVIMFGLPDNPIFYREIIEGFLGRSIQEGLLTIEEAHVRVIFSKWDALKLERIVGFARAAKMLREKGDTFEFL